MPACISRTMARGLIVEQQRSRRTFKIRTPAYCPTSTAALDSAPRIREQCAGGFVLTYRCFVLDMESHISERLSMECNTDGEAITNAGALLERRPGMITSFE